MCYDFSDVEKFLNQRYVQTTLGIIDIKFVTCSPVVRITMARDMMRNYGASIPPLLQDGVKLLIYAGEYDLLCNWIGKLHILS